MKSKILCHYLGTTPHANLTKWIRDLVQGTLGDRTGAYVHNATYFGARTGSATD